MFTINSSPMKQESLKRLYSWNVAQGLTVHKETKWYRPKRESKPAPECLMCASSWAWYVYFANKIWDPRAPKRHYWKLSPGWAEIEITEEKQILKVPFFSEKFAVNGKCSFGLSVIDSLSKHSVPRLSGTERAKVPLNWFSVMICF